MDFCRTPVLACLLVLPATNATAQEQSPGANIPASSVAVTLDGVVQDAEWSDAAILRRIHKYGGTELADPPTAVYLKYAESGNELLVGVRCFENEAGYPTAHPRRPTDYLGDDDAVQVVLGTADSNIIRTTTNFGGYEGALGTPSSRANHYYEFTVNAVGATSRTYNEGVLDRPLFQAAVASRKGEWDVEMRIPLMSAGIRNIADKTIYFNLFRFRPPDMTAWHLPAFGGYSPMPFGVIKPALPANRTMEPAPAVRHASVAPKPSAGLERISGEIEWYPLTRRAVGNVHCENLAGPRRAILKIRGGGETSRLLSDGTNLVFFDLSGSIALPLEAELVVVGNDGSQLTRATKSLGDCVKPPWFGTTVGKAYEENVVTPWTPPVVHEKSISLLGKTITFAAAGLFSAATDSHSDLLAGEPDVVLGIDGKTMPLKPASLKVSVVGTKALAEARMSFPGGGLETRSLVDYDGFTTVKMRVLGVAPRSIDRLSVRIPLRKENAKFVHRGLSQTVRTLSGFGWEGEAGALWLGGHDKGLSFDYDVPVFLSRRRRTQLQVTEERDRTWMQLNLVDGPGQVSQPGHIFRFFLQPTPTRPASLRKVNSYNGTALWHELWSDYQGYPDLAKIPQVKQRSAEAHARGDLQLLYFSQVLAENSPGFKQHKSELIAPPERNWYQRQTYPEGTPGHGVPCYVCDVCGPFGDLLLDGIAKLVDQADIDGVYMDGPSIPWECDNRCHKYCGGRPDIGWEAEDFTPYIGTRRFLKRLRGLFQDRREHFFLSTHTGGYINIATQGLCDSHLEGEQLSRFVPGYRLPLGGMAVGYCGRPWGFRTDMFPMLPTFTPQEMRTWAMLHDVQAGDGPYGSTIGRAFEKRIYSDFQDDNQVAYYPYWKSQPHISLRKGDVLFSYYRRADATLLNLGNLSWRDENVVIDVSKFYPGKDIAATNIVLRAVEGQLINPRDACICGIPLSVSSGTIALKLKKHRYAAIKLRPGPPDVSTCPGELPAANTEAFSIKSYNPSDWKFLDAMVQDRFDMGNGRRGVKVIGIADPQNSGRLSAARLTSHELFGRDCTVRLRIKHSKCLYFGIGRSGIFYDGNWQTFQTDPWDIYLDPYNREARRTGQLFQPPITSDEVEVVLSVKDGMLDALYGGKPLAKNIMLAQDWVQNGYLELLTRGNDWFAFDVVDISSQPTQLYEPDAVSHPIL